MNSKYDVSLIIINYNGKKYIDNLFRSLQQMETGGISHEIIMVNNGDDDHSIEYLKEKFGDMKQLKIVETGGNLGYAGGNNAGAECAEGEYLIFLNNDTAVDKKWLVNLFHFIKQTPFCGMANSKLLFFYDFISLTFKTTDKVILSSSIKINGMEYQIVNKFCKNLLYESERIVCFGNSEISVPLLKGDCDSKIEFYCMEDQGEGSSVICCGHNVFLKNGKSGSIILEHAEIEGNKYSLIQNAGSGINENFDGYDIGFGERDSDKYSRPYEIMSGCGASVIMLKEDFIKCGKFDERFFMYYEDSDLSFRLRKLGKKIIFCPQSLVRHIHTGSSEEWSPFFCYQVSRNKLLFVLKNVSFFQFILYFCRQWISAVKNRNCYQKWGCMDAWKIGLMGKHTDFKERCAKSEGKSRQNK